MWTRAVSPGRVARSGIADNRLLFGAARRRSRCSRSQRQRGGLRMLPSSPALVTVFFLTAILMGVVFMFLKGHKKKTK